MSVHPISTDPHFESVGQVGARVVAKAADASANSHPTDRRTAMADTALEIVTREQMPERVRHEPVRSPGGAMLAPAEQLLQMLRSGVSEGNLRTMTEFFERMEDRQKRADFDEALARAKRNFKTVGKGQHVYFKPERGPAVDYWHEDLADVEDAVRDALADEGITYRFDTENKLNEPVRVTCIVAYRGYREEQTLVGPPEGSPGMNPLQKMASTLSYLKRQTLKAALGVAARKGEDDDGRVGGSEQPTGTITDDQTKILLGLINELGMDDRSLNGWFETLQLPTNIGVADIPAASYGEALALLHLKQRAQRQKAAQT